MEKRYVVELSPAERQELESILRQARASRFRQTRARLFLKADEGADGPAWPDAKICEAFDLSPSTVLRARKQLVEEGLEAALERKSSPRPERRVLDGVREARLIAMACGSPPEGHARWTLRLLADRMVVLDHDLDHLSHETVRQALKKTSSNPT
jgi:DNA-binding transcriptional ArsR family regulator